MDELHRRLIRIGLDALAGRLRLRPRRRLRVQAHLIVNRVSNEVDLLAPINRATSKMPAGPVDGETLNAWMRWSAIAARLYRRRTAPPAALHRVQLEHAFADRRLGDPLRTLRSASRARQGRFHKR